MRRDLTSYVCERLFVPKIGAVWLMLAVMMAISGAQVLPSPWWAPAIAVLGIASFRLMDDLADRKHDIDMHPERCLAQTQHLPMFRIVAVALVVWMTIITVLGLGLYRGAGFLGLAGALFFVGRAYGLGAGRRKTVVLTVLLKYPAMVLLVAADPLSAETLVMSAVAYAIPLADEFTGQRTSFHLAASVLSLSAMANWQGILI